MNESILIVSAPSLNEYVHVYIVLIVRVPNNLFIQLIDHGHRPEMGTIGDLAALYLVYTGIYFFLKSTKSAATSF